MKIARIALLLVLLVLALTVMTGCRCKPFKEEWHFYSYREDMTFMTGVTLNMGFSDASHVYPFAGIDNQSIAISFSKDGKVEFTSKDGVTHHGTYTYEHEGLSYTSFTIKLDNGEIIEGSSMKRTKETKLAFTYQNSIYTFTTENNRSGITTADIVAKILAGDYRELNEASVVKDGERFAVRFSDMVYYPINETTAVYAIQMHTDGTYEVLNELHEGEAFSTYNNSADYIVIYYK